MPRARIGTSTAIRREAQGRRSGDRQLAQIDTLAAAIFAALVEGSNITIGFAGGHITIGTAGFSGTVDLSTASTITVEDGCITAVS